MEKVKSKVKKSHRSFLSAFRRSHPYVIPVIGVTLFTLLSCVLIIASNGKQVGASDAHIVNLQVDGKKQIVPTRALTVGDFLKSASIEISPDDSVEPALSTQINEQNTQITITRAEPVTIIDGARKITIMSAKTDPRKIVEQSNLVLFPEDTVAEDRITDPLKEGLASRKYTISRAIPVVLTIYGEQIQVRTQSKTVAQLLQEKNIIPDTSDTVVPSKEAKITSTLGVSISRFGKQVITEDKAIDSPVEYIDDATLASGSTTVKEPGTQGKKVITYEVETKDGKEVSRKIIQEVVALQPTKKVVIRGTRQLIADVNSDGIPARVYCGSPAQRNWKNINVANAALGRSLAAEKGWTGGEFTALLELWACESSWNHLAGNPYSGAYGIPQSLPANKMATAGEDYATNPRTQMVWGLNYIARGYGTPSAALAKHYRVNWY